MDSNKTATLKKTEFEFMTKTEQAAQAAFTRHGEKTFPSFSAYRKAVKREIIRMGEAPIYAQYDDAGNCLTCGECDRCPGVHCSSEVKA